MTIKITAAVVLLLIAQLLATPAKAQDDAGDIVEALSKVVPGLPQGEMYYDKTHSTIYWTNGVYFQHHEAAGNVVLTADNAVFNITTGDVRADGHVRIESFGELWVGDHINYNFRTHRMSSEEFRTGAAPIFAGGEGFSGVLGKGPGVGGAKVAGEIDATNTFLTTDDISDPLYRVRAQRVRIIPGKSVQMWHAVFYLGKVPVFYFPYFERDLGHHVNTFTVAPGYRSEYGAELLTTYRWYLGDDADGKVHVDYRAKRGPGVGPDVNLHLGQWGELSTKFYYLNDRHPYSDTNGLPYLGVIPENRQLFNLGWQATPATNLNLKAQINYQSDPLVVHDFYQGDYTADPQPDTFFEANKYWDNWSLDALATPRINSYFAQVERLPDVQLTGFRQQVFDTPIYYDSQSSVGNFRAYTGNPNSDLSYTNNVFAPDEGSYTNEATRVDTYHQFTLPWTFFNWLNVAPQVGGRLTYYTHNGYGVEPAENDVTREVLNTGLGASFKASQSWSGATNGLLQVDGLRHIIEPSANYEFVPDPSVPPAQLPQFDSELPSLMLLPVDFPDYNDIDSIDTMNVVRFGLRNILQTKRDGQVQDLVNWNMLLDWRLNPKPGQEHFNDLYSQLTFRPRTWLTMESQLRYNVDGGLNLAFHQITIAPNNRWSWGLGHWYLRGGTWGDGLWDKADYLTSTLFYRLSDDWGFRVQHNFDATSGRLQSQFYTIYKDMRSWTTSITFHVENNLGSPVSYGVSYQISLKASPSIGAGQDTLDPYSLLGE